MQVNAIKLSLKVVRFDQILDCVHAIDHFVVGNESPILKQFKIAEVRHMQVHQICSKLDGLEHFNLLLFGTILHIDQLFSDHNDSLLRRLKFL